MSDFTPCPVAWKKDMTAYAQAEKGAPMQRMRRKRLPHSCDSDASGINSPISSRANSRHTVMQTVEMTIEMPADM